MFKQEPWERCALITTKSAFSAVPPSILAHGEGLAHHRSDSALPEKPKRCNLTPGYRFIRGMPVKALCIISADDYSADTALEQL